MKDSRRRGRLKEGGKNLALKVVRLMAKALEVLQSSGQHRRDVAVVLPITEGLTMNNHLILAINEGLTVISLDGAVGSHHGGRIVVSNITLLFSTSRPHLGPVLGQPLTNLLCLLL